MVEGEDYSSDDNEPCMFQGRSAVSLNPKLLVTRSSALLSPPQVIPFQRPEKDLRLPLFLPQSDLR
jgi:hypothetical protein